MSKPHTEPTSKHVPPTLTNIPVEIRLQIYRMVFPPMLGPLRRLSDISDRSAPLNISILLANKQTHGEALAEFYALHTFHYSLDKYDSIWHGFMPKRCLSLLKHISMDLAWYADGGRGDREIARHLDSLVKRCPDLKSLTLHLLPAPTRPGSESWLVEKMSLNWAKATTPILYTLRLKLDRLSVVTFGPTDGLAEMRKEINDGENAWVCEEHRHWPALNLAIHQQRLLTSNGRRGAVVWELNQYYAPDMQVSSFHTYRPGFNKKLRKTQANGLKIETFV